MIYKRQNEHFAKIASVKEIAPKIKLFTLDIGKNFFFEPGQFVILELKSNKEIIRRSYSLASSSGANKIELCMNIVPEGKMTSRLDKIKVGDSITLLGPYGFFGKDLPKAANEIVFIATGTGITPIRPMLHHLFDNGFNREITLIYGFRHEDNFLFKEELESMASANKNFNLITTVSQPKNRDNFKGNIGRVTHFLKDYPKRDADFFICGLSEMVKDVKRALLEKGVAKERIHIDPW